MTRHICIHGHFYQPPRENPWLEDVELQDSAYPYHDWNERITTECYAPNSAARILDPDKTIIDIVSNYSRMSFNFGPTLLSWIKRHMPDVYEGIVQADAESIERFSGHGSAIAQAYNHLIMPLASERDKRTQVKWGIADFEHHFGRKPEGMWLPETAVCTSTLEVLAEQEIKFTILAPRQALGVRKTGAKDWESVEGDAIDPKMPYLCRLPSGRQINLFFYDGPISQDIAFGEVLRSGENFADRLGKSFVEDDDPQLVHIATDGETYGHHYRFGDMALAYCLYLIETEERAELTIYGEYLEQNPPTHEVRINENTSWSCVHGVERWKADCGCHSGMNPGWTQSWRAPLREAMDWLRDMLIPLYEKEISYYLDDPWGSRDDYIRVMLDRSPENIDNFFADHARDELSGEEKVTCLKLLEMQRHSMLMYTSCGWFFDEISGIENVQVMLYAARAMQLAYELNGIDLEPAYLKILRKAPGNIPEVGDGAEVYTRFVKPSVVDLMRVGAHYAVSSIFEDYQDETEIFCYKARSDIYDREDAGRQKLVTGRVHLQSDITWEEEELTFAVFHFGEHNLYAGVRKFAEERSFAEMKEELKKLFHKSDIPEIIRLMDKHFGGNSYTLWHLFRDEQRAILDQVMESELKEIENNFRRIYEDYYPLMNVMSQMGVPLPKAIATPVEFVLNTDLRDLLKRGEVDPEQLSKLIGEINKWSFELDKATLGYVAGNRIHSLMAKLHQNPRDLELLKRIEFEIGIVSNLPLELDLWKTQNLHFAVTRELLDEMRNAAEGGDEHAAAWVEHFERLGRHINVSVK